MKRVAMALTLVMALCAVTAEAGDYRYVSQAEMKTWLESNKEMLIVDIQPAKDFNRQHFAGAIETNAFPVKSDMERKQLNPALAATQGNNKDVVVICPRGKGGAKNTYDYLKGNGVAENRLYILTDGMDNWPHKELVKQR